MICGECGATIPAGVDTCGVCQSASPIAGSGDRGIAGSGDPGIAGSGEDATTLDADHDRTRLSTGASGSVGTGSGVVRQLQPGQQFGRRYTIIRLLGSGGMATVYQAWDETLATAVALKLIRADAGTPSNELRQLEERFKRELKLARQVTHPNVIRIHDLGEEDHTLYLTMEYVQGADLATLLKREPRLPLSRALALARQIGLGLAAAHRAGIVHRDLKPSNIMVDAEDHALLMDFGIARSTAAATIQTGRGAIIGTLGYMAPEQARGGSADQRTDVYAFGLILYELLAGRSASDGGDAGLPGLLTRLEKGLPALSSLRSDMPPALERIVTRCLAANPEARYPSASEVVAELDALETSNVATAAGPAPRTWHRIAAVVLAGSLTIAGTWWVVARRAPAAPAASRAPLPVLIVDFENRSGEGVFEGVLEQTLSIAIEGTPFITAFPRRDAAGLIRDLKLGSKLDENAGHLLASREGIAVILAGSIERRGDGFRIAVRAVPHGTQTPLTVAEATASDKAHVLDTLGRVARDVREALGDTTLSGPQAETFTAGSLDAIRAYTVAQDLSRAQRETEAVASYTEALRHDPEFGRAYSGLAASLLSLGRREEAQRYWNEALRRTDRMTEREKLRTYGSYYLGVARNYDKAIETFDELVRKYPADSAGYNNLAVTHFNLLNFTKAFEYGGKAIEIYPRTYKYRSNHALYAMYAGDFSTAATTAQALIKEDPAIDVPYLPLAMAALAGGENERARRVYEQAAGSAGEPGASLGAIGLADLAMVQGRYPEAIATLDAAVRRDESQGNSIAAAAKLVALAEAHSFRKESRASQSAVARARSLSQDDSVLVPAARLAIADGRLAEAREVVSVLGNRLQARSRAYAKLLEGEAAMHAKQYPAAIDHFNAARKLADLWLVRFSLGLAYFHRGDYPEALSEFEKCQTRRGEATASAIRWSTTRASGWGDRLTDSWLPASARRVRGTIQRLATATSLRLKLEAAIGFL